MHLRARPRKMHPPARRIRRKPLPRVRSHAASYPLDGAARKLGDARRHPSYTRHPKRTYWNFWRNHQVRSTPSARLFPIRHRQLCRSPSPRDNLQNSFRRHSGVFPLRNARPPRCLMPRLRPSAPRKRPARWITMGLKVCCQHAALTRLDPSPIAPSRIAPSTGPPHPKRARALCCHPPRV